MNDSVYKTQNPNEVLKANPNQTYPHDFRDDVDIADVKLLYEDIPGGKVFSDPAGLSNPCPIPPLPRITCPDEPHFIFLRVVF